MNKVIMMGRLTRDPEVRYTQGNNPMAIARFSIAVDRRFKREGDPDADFFNCTAFGKQAEFIEKYMRKGIKVVIEGRLQNNNYTDKNGNQVYAIVIMIESIEFAESKNSGSGAGGNAAGSGNAASSAPSSSNAGSAPTFDDGFMNIPDGIDEELPFN